MNRVIAKRLAGIGCSLALCISALPASAQQNEPATVEGGDAAEAESEAILVVAGRALLDAFTVLGTEIRTLETKLEASEGQERLVIGRSVVRKKVEILHLIRPILDNMLAQEREGLDTRKIHEVMESALAGLNASLERHLDAAEAQLSESREEREDVETGQLLDLEQRITVESEWVSILLQAYSDSLAQLDLIGLDSKQARARLVAHLPRRADDLAGRVEFASQVLTQSEERAELGEESAMQMLPALQVRRDNLSKKLSTTLRMMDSFELPTIEYRKVLVTSTGEITTDILDPELAKGLIDDSLTKLSASLKEAAPKFVMN